MFPEQRKTWRGLGVMLMTSSSLSYSCIRVIYSKGKKSLDTRPDKPFLTSKSQNREFHCQEFVLLFSVDGLVA